MSSLIPRLCQILDCLNASLNLNLRADLLRMQIQLRSCTYRFSPMVRYWIPKSRGRLRPITQPHPSDVLLLKGPCPIGLLDSKHILIRPSNDEDFTRLFVRRTWFVQNSPMTVSKWTLDFKPNQESSIVPIWVNFPYFPLPLFNKKYLHKLAYSQECCSRLAKL